MYRLELWFRKKDEVIAKELLGPRRAPAIVCAVLRTAHRGLSVAPIVPSGPP